MLVSPGVPHTIAPLESARRKGIPVIGEVELASRFIREPIVAVTGTNGKTTTTRMLGEMLKRSGRSVFVGGNIGCPLIERIAQIDPVDVVVAEISSFQLDTIATFRPRIGVLLNIAEDHLDRYPDLQDYARSKARLFENQQPGDVAIVNGSDSLTVASTEHVRSRKLVFADAESAGAQSLEGAVISDEGIEFRLPADIAGQDAPRHLPADTGHQRVSHFLRRRHEDGAGGGAHDTHQRTGLDPGADRSHVAIEGAGAQVELK